MRHDVSCSLAAAVMLAFSGSAALFPSSPAQAAQQTPTLASTTVDTQKLANGYRASKIIGSSVYNDNNEVIGKIDDIITSLDERDSYLVIAIGGFLSMGSKLVIMPYQSLKIVDDKLILSGATKDALKSLPEFHYAS